MKSNPLGSPKCARLLGTLLLCWAIVGVHAVKGQEGDDRPLVPLESAAKMRVPDGFHVTLFAGEPDVVQPIAFALDRRGRLWVVECLAYPDWTADGTGHDRVVIFEDTDNDGRFDRKRVFWDRGVNLSGIELGFGGVWLCSTPNFIFVPDRDGDDVPDGPAEVLLDGWDLNASHNVFNGLTWGPDGWLYGCNGILSRSRVGAPGCPDESRVPIDCGVWRYHPTRREFEVVAWGTTNPWGLDFDAYGQMLITNCVIKHLFHVVPGIHMTRMFGQDLNPYVYDLVESCADHIHWAGGYWDTSIGGKHNSMGGGHAHAGAMVYQGDNWPAPYRDRLYVHNIHGRRINCDELVKHASGYVAEHREDAFISADPWWRGLELKYGPDGTVFMTDWNDTGECHDRENTQKGTGRILRIAHGSPRPRQLDYANWSDAELIALLDDANEWIARHARLELQERGAAGELGTDTRHALAECLWRSADSRLRLRYLWALYAVEGIDANTLEKLLADPDEHLRAWAVRLAVDSKQLPASVKGAIQSRATVESSPWVRVQMAAALQRLPAPSAWRLAHDLAQNDGDQNDPLIPYLIWYGIEPLVPDTDGRDWELFARTTFPLLHRNIARRYCAEGRQGITPLVTAIGKHDSMAARAAAIEGMAAELAGLRDLAMPPGWMELVGDLANEQTPAVRHNLRQLSLVFGDRNVQQQLVTEVRDASAELIGRREALRMLTNVRAPGLVPTLVALLSDNDLRADALQGLAAYDDPAVGSAILDRYPSFTIAERQAALQTLASRRSSAQLMVNALQSGRVSRQDVSPFVATQIKQLGDELLTTQFSKLWGASRVTSETQRAKIGRLKEFLTTSRIANADPQRGRQLFVQKCATCHRLFGEGAAIGPELTGAQRENVDYVLENVVNPNALVPGDFLVRTYQLHDGRVVAGIVAADTPRTVTVQTITERLVLVKSDIEAETRSGLSLMPEGLLDDLTNEQIADLIAYLGSRAAQ